MINISNKSGQCRNTDYWADGELYSTNRGIDTVRNTDYSADGELYSTSRGIDTVIVIK
jgi:hypothetical protein